MRRAAIYARYSTDRQDERSISDQIALCEAAAVRDKLSVIAIYHDSAASGASIHGRPGLAGLMAAARERAFDVVLVESLDRLARDMEDLPAIYKRLTFVGVDIVAVHEGKADQLRVGLRSIIGAMYLTDVAQKVRRGMAGVVREGRNPGGRAYGYRPVSGSPGQLEIDAAEAEIVRRIFRDYVAGLPARAIAGALNSESIAPPRGKRWTQSTINGNRGRGHGILLNEIYAGVLVWNRVHMVKDPDTGKRVSRPNAAADVQRVAAPHLRIVDDDTWRAAQTLKTQRARTPAHRQRRPKTLLSGLMRCGCCGAGMVLHDRDHGRALFGCA
jgi:DNA invertase Pin-like site-specific DNA recombinase